MITARIRRMGEGNIFSLSTLVGRGVSHPKSVGGGGTPSQVWVEGYPISGLGGGWGYPIPGLSEGYSIPGLGEGYSISGLGGGTPCQVWMVGGWFRGYLLLTRSGWCWVTWGNLTRSGWFWVPRGTPWPGLDGGGYPGYPPHQVWVVGGYPGYPPYTTRTGWGTPHPLDRAA